MAPTLFLIAGELSADRYAARLVHALRARWPEARFAAIGGPHLREAGVSLLCDSSDWSAIGVAEALRRAPGILIGRSRLYRSIATRPPDLLLPIDFGAFNVPAAAYARCRGIPVCYLIPPGSWRPDGGRVSPGLARCADSFLTPFQASEARLRAAGLDAHWFGHPLLDQAAEREDPALKRRRIASPVVAMLPGSRGQELRHLGPAMLDAAAVLAARHDGVEFRVPLAPSLDKVEFARMLGRRGWRAAAGGDRFDGPAPLTVLRGRASEVLSAADAAMICSGTATLEAALVGCPMVVGYRGGRLSVIEYLIRRSVVPEHIALPNLLLGRRLCPELIQDDCSPARLAAEISELLLGGEAWTRQTEGFAQLRERLGSPGVIERWADFIVRRWGPQEPARCADAAPGVAGREPA